MAGADNEGTGQHSVADEVAIAAAFYREHRFGHFVAVGVNDGKESSILEIWEQSKGRNGCRGGTVL